MRRFLLLHGWSNVRPPAHWQWWLAEELRSSGEQVLYPQLPDTATPSLEAWTDVLRAELAMLGRGERVVVAHSLSTLLWLNAAPLLTPEERVDRVLLVAPPSPVLLAAEPPVVGFTHLPTDLTALHTAAASTRVVASDDDPWCPEGVEATFGHLGLETDVIPGGAHLNPDAGYGPWPRMLEWCRDPSVRF